MDRLRVIHIDLGRAWRGGQRQVWLLHRELRRRGHASGVLAPMGSPLVVECLRAGLPAAGLPGRRPWQPAVLRAVREVVRGADIVHAHDPHAATLAALAGFRDERPIAVCHRRSGFALRRGWLHRLKYRRIGRWIAVTSAIRDDLLAWGVEPDRCRTIHSAIDIDRIQAESAACDAGGVRDDIGIPRRAPMALVVAALDRQKGVDVAIDAVTQAVDRLPDLHLVVAGDGPERSALEARIRDAGVGDRVHLLGQRGDVADLITAATVCLVPSRADEGSSAALKEPMVVGRAVVASRLPGILEVVGETALLVEPGSPENLASALATVILDPDLRGRLSSRARSRVERFRPERMVDAVMASYRDGLERAAAV
jgi:glycosyltransferase involved in cell wall biosynthesis